MKKTFTNDYLRRQILKKNNNEEYDKTVIIAAIYLGIISDEDDYSTINTLSKKNPDTEYSYFTEEIENSKLTNEDNWDDNNYYSRMNDINSFDSSSSDSSSSSSSSSFDSSSSD